MATERYRSLVCDDAARRALVRTDKKLNGIDYVEVVTAPPANDQLVLEVYFIAKETPAGRQSLSEMLGRLNGATGKVTIKGGVRIKPIEVTRVTRVDDHLEVRVNEPGDFSDYTLAIEDSALDPAYSRCDFNFKAGCPSRFDCEPRQDCPPEPRLEPLIDYMAKDYASFRRALIDLIPTRAPQWVERHEADLGIALVELLAYVGDQLSYYQDAVANEAYLQAARQRVSVRRHARLIDYRMHDGASARAFVHFRVSSPGTLPAGTPVLTRVSKPLGSAAAPPGPVIPAEEAHRAIEVAGAVFESMTKAHLHPALNEMEIHPWGNRQCCLPRGTTTVDLVDNPRTLLNVGDFKDVTSLVARLRDAADRLSEYIWSQFSEPTRQLLREHESSKPPSISLLEALARELNEVLGGGVLSRDRRRFSNETVSEETLNLVEGVSRPTPKGRVRLNRLLLEEAYPKEISGGPRIGNYLLFEEIADPENGLPADADPTHRQVVRLTNVERTADQLLKDSETSLPLLLTRVTWDIADALTFPLCISARLVDGAYAPKVSVARGNLVLTDHGRTIRNEMHRGPQTPIHPSQRRAHRFLLDEGPLSFRVPQSKDNGALAPARELFTTDPTQAEPQVTRLTIGSATQGWEPVVPDLLDSDPFDPHFVVETENDGRGQLRFGDGAYGMTPPDERESAPEESNIHVTYRVGRGRSGNVGSESLVHVVAPDTLPANWPGIATVTGELPRPVRNPLAAWGGIDPEPIEEVKQLAPAAFHAEQLRAVTEEDYARAAEKHREVSKAVATFRWTGSWHTVFVTVDPVGRTDVPPELERRVREWVTRFTQAGYDLEIDPPTYVPLEIRMDVCVAPDHFRADVEEALLTALSNRTLPDRSRGFFHPDNFTFGQALYLSQLYAAVERVEGVDSALITTFQRFGRVPDRELEEGRITIDRLEIARLDNDPSFPENGMLQFNMLGGK
jgi:hypothetical protein